MRALRPWAPVRYNVRANAICPWATDTQILAGVRKRWVEENMPLNQPEDVAKMILQCSADSKMNGRAVYVAGGRGFDTEEGHNRTLPQWLGEDNAKIWLKGQEILGLVSWLLFVLPLTDSGIRETTGLRAQHGPDLCSRGAQALWPSC